MSYMLKGPDPINGMQNGRIEQMMHFYITAIYQNQFTVSFLT
jgi:hypothetical protein